MSDFASLISGLKDAKTFERGSYLEEGVYELEVSNCIWKKLRKGGDAFIVEFKMLKTSHEKHPVGGLVSWYQGFAERELALGELKLFTYAALGLDPANDKNKIEKEVNPVIEVIVKKAVEENFFRGRKVHCQVVKRTTKKGTEFSAHRFSPLKESDGKEATAKSG